MTKRNKNMLIKRQEKAMGFLLANFPNNLIYALETFEAEGTWARRNISRNRSVLFLFFTTETSLIDAGKIAGINYSTLSSIVYDFVKRFKHSRTQSKLPKFINFRYMFHPLSIAYRRHRQIKDLVYRKN